MPTAMATPNTPTNSRPVGRRRAPPLRPDIPALIALAVWALAGLAATLATSPGDISLPRRPREARASSVELLSFDNQNLNVIPVAQICAQFNSSSQQVSSASFASNHIGQIEDRAFECIANGLNVLNLMQNEISQLGDESLRSLGSLLVLRLDDNKLDKIPSKAALRWLKSLRHLNLAGNRIAAVEADAFAPELGALLSLDLRGNPLRELDANAFAGLTSLQTLSMSRASLGGRLAELRGLARLRFLNVDRNPALGELPRALCAPSAAMAPKLTSLVLRASGFARPPELAAECAHLLILDLTHNRIGGRLANAPFAFAPNLIDLYLGHNEIEFVAADAFAGLVSLQVLVLEHNRLLGVAQFALAPVKATLLHLNVAANAELEQLADSELRQLQRLKSLKCFGNPKLKRLPKLGASVEWLALTYAHHCCEYRAPSISEEAFDDEDNQDMRAATLATPILNEEPPPTSNGSGGAKQSWVPLHWLLGARWLPRRAAETEDARGVATLSRRLRLANGVLSPDLQSNLLDDDDDNMMMAEDDEYADVSDPSWPSGRHNGRDRRPRRNATDFASGVEWGDATSDAHDGLIRRPEIGRGRRAVRCFPEPSALLPCEDLLDSWWLRVGIWLVTLAALVGNSLVILVLGFIRPASSSSALANIMWYPHSSRRHIDVPRFLVINLAVADLLTGAYLATLALVDALTAGNFRFYAIEWQHSRSCKLLGFVAVVGAELSVFILAIITLERQYAITNAVHLNRRMSLHRATLIMLAGYAFAALLALLPLEGVADYSSTSICLPLDATARTSQWSREYMAALLTINSLGFLLLLGCYLRMYCAIRGSQAWNTNDTRIAKRMSVLVATDFLCWMPIICVGVASLAGHTPVGVRALKVLTIFVLPLNSVANPFLYAITTKKFKRDLVSMGERARRLMLCCRPPSNPSKGRPAAAKPGCYAHPNERRQRLDNVRIAIGVEPVHDAKGYRLAYAHSKGDQLRRHAGGAAAANQLGSSKPPKSRPPKQATMGWTHNQVTMNRTTTGAGAPCSALVLEEPQPGARYPTIMLSQPQSWLDGPTSRLSRSNSGSSRSSRSRSSSSGRSHSSGSSGSESEGSRRPTSQHNSSRLCVGHKDQREATRHLIRSLSSNEQARGLAPDAGSPQSARPKSADCCAPISATDGCQLRRRRHKSSRHDDSEEPVARCHSALGACYSSSDARRQQPEQRLLASLWSCATGSGHLRRKKLAKLGKLGSRRLGDFDHDDDQDANELVNSANLSANNANTWSSVQIMSISRSSQCLFNDDGRDSDDNSIEELRFAANNERRGCRYEDEQDITQSSLLIGELLPQLVGSPNSNGRLLAKLSERRMSKSCELVHHEGDHLVYLPCAANEQDLRLDYADMNLLDHNHNINQTDSATAAATTSTSNNDDDDRRVLIETISRLASRKRQHPRLVKMSSRCSRQPQQHYNRGNSIGARCRSWSPALLGKLDFYMGQIRSRIKGAGSNSGTHNTPVDTALGKDPSRSPREPRQDPFHDLQEQEEDDDDDFDDAEQSHEFSPRSGHRRPPAPSYRRGPLRHQSSATSDNLSTKTGATVVTNLSYSIDSADQQASRAAQPAARPSGDQEAPATPTTQARSSSET